MPHAPSHPCVVLLHTLPDASSHLDWFTARSPTPNTNPAAPLLAFRAALRPDDPTVRAFSALSLPDHRAHYLTHEGPLEPKDGRDRGAVRRLAQGMAHIERADPDAVVLVAQWGGAPRRYTGTPTETGWLFRVTAV